MADDTEAYIADQMTLFTGGYQHVMIELTAHLTGTGNTIPIGIRITDHHTGELIAYEVPAITGDAAMLMGTAIQIAHLLGFVRDQLSPF